MKIYITGDKEKFEPNQLKELNCLGDLKFLSMDDVKDLTIFDNAEEKILALDPDYFDWSLSNDFIDNIKNIKAICLNSTSYSWIDVNHCLEKGILVTNVPKYSSKSVAEYATFMMLAVAKKLPLQYKSKFACNYNDQMIMRTLEGKTAGIIGLGSIGHEIAKICDALGMNVKYWNRCSKDNDYEYVSLEKLFQESDFIFPALISNEDTRNIIKDDLIFSMKQDASFISVVHNDLYNHELLLERVKDNKLYGYAFEENNTDMFNYEGNIFVTSAYAWYSQEALDNLRRIWLKNIINVLKNDEIDIVI